MKKFLSVFLIIMLFIPNAYALNYTDYKKELSELSLYVQNTITNPTPSSVGGEWVIAGLSLVKENATDEYFNKYITNLSNLLEEKAGKLSQTKNTEYSRAAIALSALGQNATDFHGYNLLAPLLDYEKTVKQGVNGAIWALIALECGNYYPEEKALREKYINKILSMQGENGGFSLSKSFQPDPDVTAMALQALSYYKSDKAISEAIEKAQIFLKKIENFPSCESVAQTITALTALGKNSTDPEIERLLNILFSFKCLSGGYYHILSEDEENKMATEQVLCALSSLKRADKEGKWLFCFKKTFSDISECAYKNEIDILTKSGVISGKTESMFFPKSEITLAELCTMTSKAFKLKKADGISLNLKKDAWFYPYILAVYSNEILTFSDTYEIHPENKVSYREAEIFFNNCIRFLKGSSFDKDILKENGHLLREEAAKILYEIMN